MMRRFTFSLSICLFCWSLSSIGCGQQEGPQCDSDDECKGGRVCDDGECEYPAGGTSGGQSSGGTSSGSTSGSSTSGSGGETSGGETSGGETSGGETSGGETSGSGSGSGGETSGSGQGSGGETSGGEGSGGTGTTVEMCSEPCTCPEIRCNCSVGPINYRGCRVVDGQKVCATQQNCNFQPFYACTNPDSPTCEDEQPDSGVGASCNNNSECDTMLCVGWSTPEGGYCTKECSGGDCPDGFGCQTVESGAMICVRQ